MTKSSYVPSSAVIIGAGPAGLACAAKLQEAGLRVTIVDKHQEPGGRVRTKHLGSTPVDLGYQVFFRNYTHARNLLGGMPGDKWQSVPAGARYLYHHDQSVFSDNYEFWTFSKASPVDKLRMAKISLALVTKTYEQIFEDGIEESAEEWLLKQGFNPEVIDQVFRPFFAGVFLDSDLKTSSRNLQYVWQCLVRGGGMVPRGGMGELTAWWMKELKARGNVDFFGGLTVTEIRKHSLSGDKYVQGVSAIDNNGKQHFIDGDIVVVATESTVAKNLIDGFDHKLAKKIEKFQPVASHHLVVELPMMPVSGGTIWLNADEMANPRNRHRRWHLAAPMSEFYGSTDQGKSWVLVSSCVDLDLEATAMAELNAAFPGSKIRTDGKVIDKFSIPYSQFRQTPGYLIHDIDGTTEYRNLFVTGEYLQHSSIEGAVRGGEITAMKIREKLASIGAAEKANRQIAIR